MISADTAVCREGRRITRRVRAAIVAPVRLSLLTDAQAPLPGPDSARTMEGNDANSLSITPSHPPSTQRLELQLWGSRIKEWGGGGSAFVFSPGLCWESLSGNQQKQVSKRERIYGIQRPETGNVGEWNGTLVPQRPGLTLLVK